MDSPKPKGWINILEYLSMYGTYGPVQHMYAWSLRVQTCRLEKKKENPSPAEEGKNMQLRLRHHDPMIQQKNLSIVSCLIHACMHACCTFFPKHACMHIKQVLTWLPPERDDLGEEFDRAIMDALLEGFDTGAQT